MPLSIGRLLLPLLVGAVYLAAGSGAEASDSRGAGAMPSSKLTGSEQSNQNSKQQTFFQQRPFKNSRQADQGIEPSNADALLLAQPQPSDTYQYQGAIVSVKGALAFWRPDNVQLTPEKSPLVHYASQKRPADLGARLAGAPGVGSISPLPSAGKCPAAQISTRRQLFEQAESLASGARWPEVLAVEGTSIKLNLVILGYRLQLSASGTLIAGVAAPNKPIFRWTRNNEPIAHNAPRARIQQQHLLDDNDIVLQNHNRHHSLAAPIQTAAARFIALQSLQSNSSAMAFDLNAQVTSPEHNAQANNFQDLFMLAPHLNEPLIGRLEQSGKALEPKLLSALQSVGTHLKRIGHPMSLMDDFLASGQSIDWQKLEAYLRFDANLLRLHQLLQATGTEGTNLDETGQKSPGDECARRVLEQFHLVQIELAQLRAQSDGGLYLLQICQQPLSGRHATLPASDGANQTGETCQLVAGFQLHVAQDIPKLESKSEHLVLEPGERLSIKCEATGFTLPQITWFLDNQQLNEHQQHQQSQSASIDQVNAPSSSSSSSSASLLPSSSNLLKLRIGDYVSQDNHVHSFVNASSIQLTDGGFYKCQANNGFHTAELESRIDVRGPPTISRRLNNMNVLVGQSQLHIQCPYSGYPISGVEWYYRPSVASSSVISGQQRAKRWPEALSVVEANEAALFDDNGESEGHFSNEPESYLDADKDPDPDKDDWLSQANSMTTVPNSDDYPDPLPDYPSNFDYDNGGPLSPLVPSGSDRVAELGLLDYSDLGTDFQQQQSLALNRRRRRRKRDLADQREQWIKFPQSRRHQIHLNGTLILHDVTRSDQGFYRCRVIQAAKQINSQAPQASLYGSLLDHLGNNYQQQLEDLTADSNEFHLTVAVPPVISPFASTEALREGMRNFLTCSVIEGDPPVRLHWLKDNQPIEEHLQLQSSDWSGGRIRVETSNEYTSTLYFSQVDFNDSGNYTCMATNKAANVNYTARMLVNVPPKWINAPKDVECVAGQSIVIDCQARAHPNPRVWWEIGLYSSREDQVIQATNGSGANGNNNNNRHDQVSGAASNANAGQQHHLQQMLQATAMQPPNHYRTIISNSRIHILENASLVIRDVHRLDQGYYLCQAANNFGSLSALIKLTVNVGASFSSKYLMKYVKLNEKVELDCDPIGQSPVDIVWLLKQPSSTDSPSNQAVLQLNHTNSIHQTVSSSQNLATSNQSSTSSDAAAGGLGRRLFIGTIRTELAHSQRQSDQSSNTATVGKSSHMDNQQLHLQDQFSSSQPFFDRQLPPGEPNEPLASFDILKRQNQEGSEFVRLYIKKARRAHSGDLICQASNRYGTDEKLIKLLVQEPPEPVREISAVQVDSRAVVLTWLAPYNGNSPITSYTVEWIQVSSQNQQQPYTTTGKWSHMTTQQPTATISPLSAMTTYEIRIKARNLLGQSTFATATGAPPFLITTIEEAPVAPPSDLRMIPLSSSSLQLSWLPPGDMDSHNGLKSSTQNGINPTYSIKGYYLGYKAADTNDSFVFKTVSLLDGSAGSSIAGDSDHLLASSDPVANNSSPDQRQSLKSESTSLARRLKVTINNLRRSTKYIIIVQAFNSAGPGPQSDQIEAKTLADDPPPAPLLRVGLVTYSSIELQWSFQLTSDGGSDFQASNGLNKLEKNASTGSSKLVDSTNEKDVSVVDGYHVYYRPLEGQWAEQTLTPETHAIISSGHQRNDLSIVELSSEKSTTTTGPDKSKQSAHGWHRNSSTLASKSFRFMLDQLACGNTYQIYLVAYNSIGSGLPSQIIRAKTRGSSPIAPRRQDYISVNSTFVQLNFESWMDGGCSITNFEVKYKSLSRSSILQSQSTTDSSNLASGGYNTGQNQWLLLSSNVSPEQRLIELRDLQPETWYAVLTTAESAAGKTEIQYSFMTLNKWGQLPAEAMESSNLPALFRQSNASIRSILYNFVPSGHMSALMMSACMCLVLFATCLLFAIRWYGGQLKDSASLDSQATTSGAFSGSGSHYQHHHTQSKKSAQHSNGRYHHHTGNYGDQQAIGDELATKLCEQQPMIYGAANEQPTEFFSLKASPCETTTSNIVIGCGNSASNGSSSRTCGSGMLNGSSCSNNPGNSHALPELSVDLNQFLNSNRLAQIEHQQCSHLPTQFQSSTLGPHHNSQNYDEYRCSPGCAESPIVSPDRTVFGNLTRDNATLDKSSRFKTLACRPVSTFVTNNNMQNGIVPGFVCNGSSGQSDQQLNLEDYQHQLNDQHQIYSKLRLIYNTHSNYNLCPVEESQKNNQVVLDTNDQICNGDAMNLAVLTQEQNQSKLLARTLMRANHQQQKNVYLHNGECVRQAGMNANSVDLNSLVMNCQKQPLQLDVCTKNNYGQYQMSKQVVDNDGILSANGYGTSYCPPSITSGSTSTNTDSSQPTNSSSISHNSDNNEQPTNLISLANADRGSVNLSSVAGSPCQKSATKVSVPSQAQQNHGGQQAGLPSNEPSDYAQPFPPKWV